MSENNHKNNQDMQSKPQIIFIKCLSLKKGLQSYFFLLYKHKFFITSSSILLKLKYFFQNCFQILLYVLFYFSMRKFSFLRMKSQLKKLVLFNEAFLLFTYFYLEIYHSQHKKFTHLKCQKFVNYKITSIASLYFLQKFARFFL